MTAAAFALTGDPSPRITRTPAEWRVRFELLAASRWHVDGYQRDAARSWAYYELLAEWAEQDAHASTMPSSEAEPIARAALAELGVVEPRPEPASLPRGATVRAIGGASQLPASGTSPLPDANAGDFNRGTKPQGEKR